MAYLRHPGAQSKRGDSEQADIPMFNRKTSGVHALKEPVHPSETNRIFCTVVRHAERSEGSLSGSIFAASHRVAPSEESRGVTHAQWPVKGKNKAGRRKDP